MNVWRGLFCGLCLAVLVGGCLVTDDPLRSRVLPCTGDSDCPAGGACGVDGLCLAAPGTCVSDGDCPAGFGCSAGGACIRRVSCATDLECATALGAGFVCGATAECELRPPCAVDADCPGGTYCSLDGTCETPVWCETHADCGPDAYCVSVPDVFDGQRHCHTFSCSPEVACPAGFRCDDAGHCQIGCADEADCPAGERCESATGQCIPKCGSDGAQCAATHFCSAHDGRCYPRCQNDSQCATGHRCFADGRCRLAEPCLSSAACTTPATCVDVTASSEGHCVLQAADRECLGASDCRQILGPAWACAEGGDCVLVATCGQDADCLSGSFCDATLGQCHYAFSL